MAPKVSGKYVGDDVRFDNTKVLCVSSRRTDFESEHAATSEAGRLRLRDGQGKHVTIVEKDLKKRLSENLRRTEGMEDVENYTIATLLDNISFKIK